MKVQPLAGSKLPWTVHIHAHMAVLIRLGELSGEEEEENEKEEEDMKLGGEILGRM